MDSSASTKFNMTCSFKHDKASDCGCGSIKISKAVKTCLKSKLLCKKEDMHHIYFVGSEYHVWCPVVFYISVEREHNNSIHVI